ncbi:MAG: hypothetical protein IIA59_12195 [Candidatus Marinimicrobia bacterium]|nr:hypothetical protein [Candidatus Neomarinimicrobiota bacterium]
MKWTKTWAGVAMIAASAIFPGAAAGQAVGGDILNEAPLTPVPAEMTFEEYRDMNRRLTVGLALSAIPLPGMIHFYAGEKKTGLIIVGTVVVGAASIIAGVTGSEKGAFPESDFELFVLNSGVDKERRYEKIPRQLSAGDTTYQLHEIFRDSKPGQPLLLLAGVGLVAGGILYDIIHGITTIERKRDAVRYKYGRLMSGISVEPQIDLGRHWAGLTLSIRL